MSADSILSDRDVNAPLNGNGTEDAKGVAASAPAKTLEYHRQRLNEEKSSHKYVSPSDGIMSPCTAKLSAHRNKHFMKAKPQALFGKASMSKTPSSLSFEEAADKVNGKESGVESGTDDSRVVSTESSPGQ